LFGIGNCSCNHPLYLTFGFCIPIKTYEQTVSADEAKQSNAIHGKTIATNFPSGDTSRFD